MKYYCDRFTGKRVDKLSDLLPEFNGQKCDECGSECINRCFVCGAPQCCPVCCAKSEAESASDYRAQSKEAFIERMAGIKTGLDASNNPDNW